MIKVTELGTRLKEARLSKGYSLDDLQEITKIQKRYLVGIEEGNYSIMPGTFYVRAFIKQYAEAVGLKSEELLEQYKNEVPSTHPDEVTQSVPYTPTRRNSRSSGRMMETAPKLIVALFIIVIIAVIWFLYSQKVQNTPDEVQDEQTEFEYDQKPTPTPNEGNENGETTGSGEGEDEGEATEEETEPEEPVEEEPVVEQSITVSETRIEADGSVTTVNELSGTETINIRVVVSGDTWVGIQDANRAEQIAADVYRAGDEVTFDATANAYARIRLGNANNAKIFINDIEVAYTTNPQERGKSVQNMIFKFAEEAEQQQ